MFAKGQAQREAYSELKSLYPDADTLWLKQCVRHYNSQDSGEIVQLVTEKIMERQFGTYPKRVDPRIKPNHDLLEIIERFPDCEIAHLRNEILKHKCNTVYSVTESLLLQASRSGYPKRRENSYIKEEDLFRDPDYVQGTKSRLMNMFPYHWELTIQAIMAENNNNFTLSKAKLEQNPVNMFWKTLPFTKRRKDYTFKNEMNHTSLLAEIQALEHMDTVDDLAVAEKFNSIEYESNNQWISCQCCYSDCTFEDLISCDEGHLFCKTCVERALTIGMYDTGSVRGRPLKCMSSEIDCESFIADSSIQQCVSSDLYENYQATLAERIIKESGIHIVQCPFCKYIEEQPEISRFQVIKRILQFLYLHWRGTLWIFATSVGVILSMFSRNIFETTYFYCIACILLKNFYTKFEIEINRKLKSLPIPHILRFETPLIFNCKNPKCLKVSCVDCQKQWLPLHRCHEKEHDSLRLYVELAMSQALIRTHFRIVPGSKCTECKKCDLYQKEADAQVVKLAAIEAEKEWRRQNPEAAQMI
ncbi:hypothetical protein HDV04_000938 [Boothiomyces sp. JEL0838]|nr:hypothetical protein HDV04_000889 [Boothiomyces sp. JEL0838]KAJ3314215.1 hypothetical protein HDV04_000938 [Boothiomyces sp. JEL0838]